MHGVLFFRVYEPPGLSKIYTKNVLFVSDDGSPVIENYTKTGELSRTKGINVTLSCRILGQPGMIVKWTRDGNTVEHTNFEKYITVYPMYHIISGVVESKLTITYTSDLDIYKKFNCTKSKNNWGRILFCRSVYACSAEYPGAKTVAQKDMTVTVKPNLSKCLTRNICNIYMSARLA